MVQKIALMVGAFSGLGLSITEELLQGGWAVIATARAGRNENL